MNTEWVTGGDCWPVCGPLRGRAPNRRASRRQAAARRRERCRSGCWASPCGDSRPPAPATVMRRRTSPSSRQNMTPSRPWEKMTEIAAGSSRAGSPSTTASSQQGERTAGKAPGSRRRRWPERASNSRPRSRRGGSPITRRRAVGQVDRELRPSGRFRRPCQDRRGGLPSSANASSRLPVFATQRVEGRLVFTSPQAAQQAAAEAEGLRRAACGSWP